MSDPVEAGGQDMAQEPADELVGGQAHDLHPVPPLDPIVFPAERHGVRVGTDQAMVRNRDAVRVAAEIGQHSLGSAEGWFGIDDPVGLTQRREMSREGNWAVQKRQIAEEGEFPRLVMSGQPFGEQAPEQPRQELHR